MIHPTRAKLNKEILGYFVMDDAIGQEWNNTGKPTRTNYSNFFTDKLKNGKINSLP